MTSFVPAAASQAAQPQQSFATLLFTAARARCRPEHLQRLAQAWDNLPDWQGLAEYAEEQGLAPLFYHHAREAGLDLPAALRLQLQGLALRHRLANQQLAAQLSAILPACQAAGIDVLLLKGAALFCLVYPDPSLRPMRDLDLLTRPEQARQLHSLLQELGFHPDQGNELPSLHHLPSLRKPAGDLLVSVEVHYNLFDATWRAHPPRIHEWIDRARPFDFNGQAARTLGLEDMLWHIYQHAINGSLRLVSLADLVSASEYFAEQIDWGMVRRSYPALLRALALIHAHSPLDDRLLQCAGIDATARQIPLGAGPQGWPSRSLAEGRAMGLGRYLRATFQPSDWWLSLYYGIKNGRTIPLYRWVIHPFEILRIAGIRLSLRLQGLKR